VFNLVNGVFARVTTETLLEELDEVVDEGLAFLLVEWLRF
jgi:hypothetical protein